MTTLVSFIGKGKKDRQKSAQAYERLTYHFKNGKDISSAVFFDAVLRSGEYSPDKCILLGTRTSSWATLLDNLLDDHEDLLGLCQRLEESEGTGVSDLALNELGETLGSIWSRTVVCYAHASEVTEENALEVITGYFAAIGGTADDDEEIVVDITHSFRSMPTLLMVSLQMRRALAPAKADRISIIYGELRHPDNGPSPVRYLEPAWRGIALAQAIRFFFEGFDATELAAQVEPFWPDGSAAIKRLGDTVQALCLTKIDEVVRQMGNALANKPEQSPSWFGPVFDRCRELHRRLDKRPCHACIAALAAVLAENRNYGLALISLQLASEACILDKLNAMKDYGNYDAMYGQNGHWTSFLRANPGVKSDLRVIRNARNMVAHGGAQSAGGGLPQAENLPKLYTQCKQSLERVFKE